MYEKYILADGKRGCEGKKRIREILKGEEGMGTVEVILIILEIFTP